MKNLKYVLERVSNRFWDLTTIECVRVPLQRPSGPNEIILNVQNFRQTKGHTCGVVAGWIVVKYFHPKSDFSKLFYAMNPSPVWGIPTKKMIAALRKHKIAVSYRKRARFQDIKDAIDQGFPVITCVDRPTENEAHWLVLRGYGTKPACVFVAGDYIFSSQKRMWSSFKRIWNEREILICRPRT